MCVPSLGRGPSLVTLRVADHPAPLPAELSRQEYWRGPPFPLLQGGLPDPEMEAAFLALADRFFAAAPLGKCRTNSSSNKNYSNRQRALILTTHTYYQLIHGNLHRLHYHHPVLQMKKPKKR